MARVPALAFELAERTEGSRTVALFRGRLVHGDAGALASRLDALAREHPADLVLDLGAVEEIDGGAAAVLADFVERARAAGRAPELASVPPAAAALLSLYTTRDGRSTVSPPRPERVLHQVGRATIQLVANLRTSLGFLGECTFALLQAVRNPRSVRWSAVVEQVERIGADGLPIVLLIGFLIGLITAFQAAVQLEKLGADTFVVNLVALSLTRELAPLLTAIVIAGRSGAAISAEIGTMKVSEEIDALRVMGFCPYRFLVFPRVLALVIALPILTLFADAIGIAGGALIVLTQLDVSLVGYLNSTREALTLNDVFGGLLKTLVFGLLIGMIACERGMGTLGGAEGVGRSTTQAVVRSLFHIIFVDALFTVLYKMLGI